MKILDGLLTAQKLKADLKQKVSGFIRKHKIRPGLRVILIGNNPASKIYVRQKLRSAKEVGIDSRLLSIPETAENLKNTIQSLNQDPAVHALLVQLPLPSKFPWKQVISWIDPQKDVDGLTLTNQGLLYCNQAEVKPCTPLGIMKLLESYNISLKGKNAVVVGRSRIVGLPTAHIFLQANATVSLCHSHTKKLSQFTRQADIVVSAVGRPGLLGKKDLKKGAVVVDVGIHRVREGGKTKLKGDIRFKELKDHVSYATPVPGGVGPMTVAMLLENTFQLACRAEEKKSK